MNFKDMSAEELMERRAAIGQEIEAPDADLDALEQEARAINTELENRKAEEAKRKEAFNSFVLRFAIGFSFAVAAAATYVALVF